MKRLVVAALLAWLGAIAAAFAQPDQVHIVPEFTFRSPALQSTPVSYHSPWKFFAL
jgi:hypothetical protein